MSTEASNLLARACARAAAREDPSELLDLALRACGADRAFLVSAPCDGGEPCVEAVAARPGVERGRLSRSLSRRALDAARPALLLDLDPSGVDGAESVRALGLRAVCLARLTYTAGRPIAGRRAILLDTRRGFALAAVPLRETLEAFAALLSLIPAHPATRAEEHPSVGTAARESLTPGGVDSWIRRVARTELPVLVLGESGSGKERVARALHTLGPRSAGPWVAVNCAAVTETLLEAELFGVVRGAYTGADRDRPGLFGQAHAGTLFLDEVGDMPLPMQGKLLRVLETGRFRPVGARSECAADARIVAATHRDLEQRAEDGRFRSDLLHRLAVLRIEVPPLRARVEELAAIVAELTPRLLRQTGAEQLRVEAGTWRALRAYDWPGNVRELHAVLARALLRANGRSIAVAHLDPILRSGAPSPLFGTLERRMIERALGEVGGCIAGAAERIGWTRQKLYRRMEALGVDRAVRAADGPAAQLGGTTSSDSSTFQ